MAKSTNMIQVISKDGETITHFDRNSFMKLKADKEGYRGGWKPYGGETSVPGQLGKPNSANTNVPDVLKQFSPEKTKQGVTEEEVQRRIQAAIEKDRAARTRSENKEGLGDQGKDEDPNAKKNTVNDLPDTTGKDSEKATELKDVKERVEKNTPAKPEDKKRNQ